MFLAITLASFVQATLPPEPSMADSERQAPAQTMFLAGFAVDRSGLWVTEIYSSQAQSEDGGHRYVARRSLMTPFGREQSESVDSQTCPAIADVAVAMDDLTSPRLSLPGVRRWSSLTAPKAVSTDSPLYRVWGKGRQPDGYFADLSMSSNGGLLADTVQRMNDHLMPCWGKR